MEFLKKITSVFTKSVTDTSPKGKVDSTDVAKLIKTSVIVGIAGAVSYFTTNIAPETLGPYQPLIMMGLTALLDFTNKLVKDNMEN